MKLRPSLPFEGKCDICNEEKVVHTVGDEETHRVVTLCSDCLKNYTDEEIFEKFGHIDEKIFEGSISSAADINYVVKGGDKLLAGKVDAKGKGAKNKK